MPQVIFTQHALDDLERLHTFLQDKNPEAAKQAAEAILKTIQLLEQHPELGRPIEEMDLMYREIIIQFGSSGYIARYYLAESVVILAIRHQKEAGYTRS